MGTKMELGILDKARLPRSSPGWRVVPKILSLMIVRWFGMDNPGITIHFSKNAEITEQLWGILFYSVPRNPNGRGLPHWPQYDQKEEYLQIGATTQQSQRLKAEEVAFWTQLLAKRQPQPHHNELWMQVSVSFRTSKPRYCSSSKDVCKWKMDLEDPEEFCNRDRENPGKRNICTWHQFRE